MSKKFINSLSLCFLVLLSYLALYSIDSKVQKLKPIIDLQNEVVNLNPKIIKVLSFGQERMLASIIWTHTILKSDIKHYELKNLKNWMYIRINTVTELAPYFYEAYYIGAQYLSIVKDDEIGAKEIYDKAILKFPKDYKLLYGAGFHYYYELGDKKSAVKLFGKSIANGNKMHFLPTLVAKIKADENELEAAQKILEESIKVQTNDILKKRLLNFLVMIQIEIDINCLNSIVGNKKCNVLDPNGQKYNKEGNKYSPPKYWRKFKTSDKF